MGESKSKTVALILTNQTDDPRILTLTPGMTVAQAFAEAGVRSDSSMSHPDGGHTLGLDEDLFALCDEGDKLKVTPAFTAGVWWNPLSWSQPPQEPLAKDYSPPARPSSLSSQPVAIPSIVAAISATDERWLRRYGWRRDGKRWLGYFRIAGKPPLRACIDFDGSMPRASFEGPPSVVLQHRCVHPLPNSPGWFWVNEHGPVPGRTLRGFVTSIESWMDKLMGPAPNTALTHRPEVAEPQLALALKGTRNRRDAQGDAW